MSAREKILSQLRAAGGPSVPLPGNCAQAPLNANIVELFAARASAVGVEVMVTALERLPSEIVRAVLSTGARAVAIWDDPLLTPVASALMAASIETVSAAQQTTARLAEVDIGITTADYAIAETGTLVLACSAGRPRATSLLPPLHVAVVPRERVVATLGDLISRFSNLPSALTLITGPSRTADIELTPVRGVHGPTSVRVYLLA